MPLSFKNARTAAQDAVDAARHGLTFTRANYWELRQFRSESKEFARAWSEASFIHGWMRRSEADLLFELAAAVPVGQDIVEVGSYLGRSTAFLGLGAGPGVTVHAVDPMTSEQFQGNMEKVGVTDKLETHTAFSVDAARDYAGRPIGMLFIDAIHTERAVFEDGTVWSPHLAPGCLVAFDDFNRATVVKGVQRLVDGGLLPPLAGRVGKVGLCSAPDRVPARVRAIMRRG